MLWHTFKQFLKHAIQHYVTSQPSPMTQTDRNGGDGLGACRAQQPDRSVGRILKNNRYIMSAVVCWLVGCVLSVCLSFFYLSFFLSVFLSFLPSFFLFSIFLSFLFFSIVFRFLSFGSCIPHPPIPFSSWSKENLGVRFLCIRFFSYLTMETRVSHSVFVAGAR